MKKILSLFLSFVIFAASGWVVFAEDTIEAEVYGEIQMNADGTYTLSEEKLFEGTLEGAVGYMNSARKGRGIVLKKNVKLTKGLTLQPVEDTASFVLIDGMVTLDLNGYFFTQLSGGNLSDMPLLMVPKDSTLTFCDSSEAQNGVLNGVQYAVKVSGGHLNLEGGCLQAWSQASPYPDDEEVPLMITNGGTVNMYGGKIHHDGQLEDGRTYMGLSCAVYADKTGKLFVGDGCIIGDVEFRTEENFTVNGGSFTFDVSKKLPKVYELIEKDGLFVVEKYLPEVKGSVNEKDVNCVVSAAYNDTETSVVEYQVKVDFESQDNVKCKLDISDIIFEAFHYETKKNPNIIINTSIAVITLDEDSIRLLQGDGTKKKIFLVLEKNYDISRELSEKVDTAKYIISCSFLNENGEKLSSAGKPKMEILHSSENALNGVQLYTVSGASVLVKTSTLKGNVVTCNVTNGESVIVSEGVVIMITGRTLDLQGTISMIFYAALEGVDVGRTKMLFWDSPRDEYTMETADRIVSNSGKDSNGYRFRYTNISSKDMGKKVYARLMTVNEKGEKIYSSVPKVGYSVKSYAQNMLKNQKLKPLLVKMLNYGAAAQEYFGSEDKPANDVLSDVEKVVDFTKIYKSESETIVEATDGGKCSAKIAGKTLILEGDISINYYVASNEVVDEMGIMFWTESAYKRTKNHVVGTQSGLTRTYSANGGYKVYTFGNIVSRQIFDNIYARVYTRTGNVYKYGDIDKYSVRDYAANQIEKNEDPGLIKLLRCLLLYGDEAEKYFRLH